MKSFHILLIVLLGFMMNIMIVKDRIVEINDYDVTTWSHNTILTFVRSLTLNLQATSSEDRKNNLYRFHFSLGLISHKRLLVNPVHSIPRREVRAVLLISETGRMTIDNIHSRASQIQYYRTLEPRVVKHSSGMHLNVPRNTTSIRIEPIWGDAFATTAAFRLHEYQVSSGQPGLFFTFESKLNGQFLHFSSGDEATQISLMASNNSVSDLRTIDSRLFRVTTGSSLMATTMESVLLQHMKSGKYVTVERNGGALKILLRQNENSSSRFTIYEPSLDG